MHIFVFDKLFSLCFVFQFLVVVHIYIDQKGFFPG
jgi:hypothetical protein